MVVTKEAQSLIDLINTIGTNELTVIEVKAVVNHSTGDVKLLKRYYLITKDRKLVSLNYLLNKVFPEYKLDIDENLIVWNQDFVYLVNKMEKLIGRELIRIDY